MRIGTEVILTEDARGNKKGTKGYFGGYDTDSRYSVAVFIIAEHSGLIGLDLDAREAAIRDVSERMNLQIRYDCCLPLGKHILSRQQIHDQMDSTRALMQKLEDDSTQLLFYSNAYFSKPWEG